MSDLIFPVSGNTNDNKAAIKDIEANKTIDNLGHIVSRFFEYGAMAPPSLEITAQIPRQVFLWDVGNISDP